MDVTPPNPSAAMADPRLKAVCYLILKRNIQNGMISRFEILDNDVYWEFPIPDVESPYHWHVTFPHERVLAEPWVVWGEIVTQVARELLRVKGASDPRVAAHVGRGGFL